jgi:hypothetical protein
MENTTNNSASVEKTGNADELIAGPAKGDVLTGQPAIQSSPTINEENKPTEEVVPKKQYEELETKLGSQGTELGEYREFFNQITPLLNKLDQQPELVQAIIDGKVDGPLAKAVLEGKVSIKEAETVTKAHEEVKKDVGSQTYNTLKPEEVEKLVSEKVEKMATTIGDNLKKNIDEVEEIRNFEKKTSDFINSTPDFVDYADDISKWFDEHENQDDIEIAYNAVKGIVLDKKSKEAQQKNEGEAAKAVAADVGGGPSQNASVVQDKRVIDELIGGRTNPNIF